MDCFQGLIKRRYKSLSVVIKAASAVTQEAWPRPSVGCRVPVHTPGGQTHGDHTWASPLIGAEAVVPLPNTPSVSALFCQVGLDPVS